MPRIPLARLKLIAQRRLETIQRFRRLVKNHGSKKASRMVGVSVPTLWRWSKQLSAFGPAGLYPKDYKRGPRSPFSGIRLTRRAVRELELFLVEQHSPRAAWRQFAELSAACPPSIVAYIRRYGRAPAQFATAVRLNAVQARCYISTDGRRLFVRLPARGTLTAHLSIPAGFKLKGANT